MSHSRLYWYLANNVGWLSSVLELALLSTAKTQEAYYAHRTYAWRHLAFERDVLVPELMRIPNDRAYAFPEVELYYAAHVSLLIPTPSLPILGALQMLMKKYDPHEGDLANWYNRIDQLPLKRSDELLDQAVSFPIEDLPKHNDEFLVFLSIKMNLERAGLPAEAGNVMDSRQVQFRPVTS